jgi:hypothetical protein
MLPTPIDNSLVIAASMALMPCGHPEALPEVQRQMRLINRAYPDPGVLRCTDEVVRSATILHGPPGDDSESERRHRMQAALERLRACLEGLPHLPPRPLRARVR